MGHDDRRDDADGGDGLVPDPNLDAFRATCMRAFAEACAVRRRTDRGWPMLRRRLQGQRVTDEWVLRRMSLNRSYAMLVEENQDALAPALELATKCIDYSFFRRDLSPAQVNIAVFRLDRQERERRERAAEALAHPVAAVAEAIRRYRKKKQERDPGDD